MHGKFTTSIHRMHQRSGSIVLFAWLPVSIVPSKFHCGIFGEHLGVAFQIRDDVFDLEGETEVVGKSVGRDLAKGKLTLPMIILLDSADPVTFADAVDAFRQRDASAVLQLLRDADATGNAIAFAVKQVEAAKSAIEGLPLGGTEDLLRDLADSVVDRNH